MRQDMNEESMLSKLWDIHYGRYIQKHKEDKKDLFQLTNEAIAYCMEQLELTSKEKRG